MGLEIGVIRQLQLQRGIRIFLFLFSGDHQIIKRLQLWRPRFLLYPAVATLIRSFFGSGTELLGPGAEFVGLKNWTHVFTSKTMLTALRNNALWAVVFTLGTVTLGLVFAVLLDRVRYEKWLKAAMLLHIRNTFPKVTIVTTDNATSNAPMLSINERLGFAVHKESVTTQISTKDLGLYVISLQK